jgi:uridine kinase
VEGLYTINELPVLHSPFKIYVDSPAEELVFRRLVRDQERLSEPLSMQINNLSRVFPMWTIYGQPQKKKADLIVDNTFEILSTTGKKSTYIDFDTPRSQL